MDADRLRPHVDDTSLKIDAIQRRRNILFEERKERF